MSGDDFDILPPGTLLNEFQIDGVLGAGGFGVTYLAHDTLLEVPRAIKEFMPADHARRVSVSRVEPLYAESAEIFEWGLERFIEEARTLARFQNHPNIVNVLRVFEANGTAYMVMSYEQGETLLDRIKTQGRIEESELRLLLGGILDGLEAVHVAGLLHRDIKPDNIYIREFQGQKDAVLLDFGSARRAVGEKSQSLAALYADGYSPVEQYSVDGDLGPWSDIYALGATLYRAVTGERPQAATERFLEDRMVPAVEAAAGNYDPALLEAIDAALKLSANDRPVSVRDWRLEYGLEFDDRSRRRPMPIVPVDDDGGDAGEDSLRNWDEIPLDDLQHAAGTGDADAQYHLAIRYWVGDEAEVKPKTIVKWMRRAAEAGHPSAQIELGYFYETGLYVGENQETATQWYALAAESGDPIALTNLGNQYAYGRGVEIDTDRAYDLYRHAADQGHAEAMYQLGVLFSRTDVVEPDYVQSRNWYQAAVDHGHIKALNELGVLLDKGLAGETNHARAFELFMAAAAEDMTVASYNLGLMYDCGRGTAEDVNAALRWYRKAATEGDESAQFRLGEFYEQGRGVEQDAWKAEEWYRRAAENGHPDAQSRIDALKTPVESRPKSERTRSSLTLIEWIVILAVLSGIGIGIKWYMTPSDGGNPGGGILSDVELPSIPESVKDAPAEIVGAGWKRVKGLFGAGQWEATLLEGSESRFTKVVPVDGGDVLATGYYRTPELGFLHFWSARVDSGGDTKWTWPHAGTYSRYMEDNHFFAAGEDPLGTVQMFGHGRGGASADVVRLSVDDGEVKNETALALFEAAKYYDTAMGPDGALAVVGFGYENYGGGGNIGGWYGVIGANDAVETSHLIGGNKADAFEAVAWLPDGDMVSAGYTASKGRGGEDFWVVRMNRHGDVIWDRAYGSGRDDIATHVAATIDGGMIVSGFIRGDSNGSGDFWILRLDGAGNVLWNRSYGPAVPSYDYDESENPGRKIAGGLAVAGKGEYVAALTVRTNDGPGAIRILKIRDGGDIVWDRLYRVHADQEAASVVAVDGGGFVVAGRVKTHDDVSVWRGLLLKIDAEGRWRESE